MVWGIVLVVIFGLLALFLLNVDNSPVVPEQNNGEVAGLLIFGAACEQDNDCVYALNAYPTQKCVSQNCPPATEAQPSPGDPTYEWMDTYLDECVNAGVLEGKNVQGEDLILDERGASCTCAPFQSPDGIATSLDGAKLCRKIVTGNETPIENQGI